MKLRKRSGLWKLAVLPLAFLLSAATHYQVNHGTDQNIDEHGECRNVANAHASGWAIFVPTNTSTEWQAFRDNAPTGVTVTACGCAVTPGSESFTTAGTHAFTIPCHNTMTVEVWGAGGGGAGAASSAKAGAAGGASNFDGVLVANGGAGAPGTGAGAGGTASGGTTNTTGQNGGTGSGSNKGGNGANGGAGGAASASNTHGKPGTAPGGAGSGGRYAPPMGGGGTVGGGGGGGGYSTRAYAAGTYTVGASVNVVVGAGGAGGNSNYDGGLGALGRVTITWN